MQKRHDDTRFRDSGESRRGQGFWSTIVGEHGGATGVPNRFPDPGLPRPALLPCTKMSVLENMQVARKFSTTYADLQFYYYIEYYSNRRRCRRCRACLASCRGIKKTAVHFVLPPGRIFSRRAVERL